MSLKYLVNAKTILIASSLSMILSLSGCGLFSDDGALRNRGDDYRNAREMPPTRVPEGMDKGAMGELYVVPTIPETSILEETAQVPRPQSVSSNALEQEVKIQSLGGKRWILINRAPGEVWPRVRNILNSNGIPTAVADAPAGVIETEWVELNNDTAAKHRYRFRIEQGVQPKSTEITILHSQTGADSVAIPAWPERSTSDDRESSMAEVMANALAGDLTSGTVSLLAQSIGGGSKADVLAPKNAEPYLLVKLDFNRAWASVGYAVSHEGFSIVDQDRTAGVIDVHYGDDEEDEGPGFFKRWLGLGDDVSAPLAANYQVRVRAGDKGVEVRVTGAEQGEVERTQLLRLLKKIRANLS